MDFLADEEEPGSFLSFKVVLLLDALVDFLSGDLALGELGSSGVLGFLLAEEKIFVTDFIPPGEKEAFR